MNIQILVLSRCEPISFLVNIFSVNIELPFDNSAFLITISPFNVPKIIESLVTFKIFPGLEILVLQKCAFQIIIF